MPREYRVLCRGLPWECTDQELRDFFDDEGIEELDIPRRNGRATGDGTVTFLTEDDYKKALKKDREHLGSRYIEVFPFDNVPKRRNEREDFRPRWGQRDRDMDRGYQRGSDPVVRLRGLPFSVTVKDIEDFLAPLPIVRDGILLPGQKHARPAGEAYVCFDSVESVKIARQRHMKSIGHRYIEVFDASLRELQRFADDNNLRVPRCGPSPFVSPPRGAYDPYAQSAAYRNGGGAGYRQPEPEDPYGRSRAAMDPYQQSAYGAAPAAGYFDSYAPKQAYASYGRERGPDPRDVRAPLDPRDVREAERDPREAPRDARLADPRAGDVPRPAPVDPYTGEPRYPDYGYESRDPYYRGGAGGQPASGGAAPPPSGRDPYSARDSWAGAPPSDRDRYGSGAYLSEPYGDREAGGAIRRPEYGRPEPRPDPYGYGRDRDYGVNSTSSAQFILRMRGVPFRASEGDIYDFFHPIRPNQVELLYDHQYQRPSGDARVVFTSRKDYDDALLKDKQYMGERYIEMIPDNGRY